MRFNEKQVGLSLVLLGAGWLAFSLLSGSAPEVPIAKHVENYAETQTDTVTKTADKQKREACKVLTVYDGDTLGCDRNGNGKMDRPRETVRLLGIDTPEMRYSRKNKTHNDAKPQDEPFAKEGSRWLEEHALRKTVYLEFDQKRRDRFERTLAYVYAGENDTESLNAQLLSTGYAKVLFIGKNRRHEKEFLKIEDEARAQKRGLWGKTQGVKP